MLKNSYLFLKNHFLQLLPRHTDSLQLFKQKSDLAYLINDFKLPSSFMLSSKRESDLQYLTALLNYSECFLFNRSVKYEKARRNVLPRKLN